MAYDRPIHRLDYQWQASIHFSWPIVGQYDVIFIGTTKKFQIQTVGQTEESIIMSEFYISNPYRQLDRHST